MGCSIWRWYEGDGKREKPFAINSVVEGSLALITTPKKGKKEKDEYKARIITYELEKRQKYFECAVSDYVKEVLEKEAGYQSKGKTQHYGLIIVKPGRPNLADSIVMDFISFHRHPVVDTEKPTTSRYGIATYNEVFETRALKELALKDAQRSKHTIEETISQIVDVDAGAVK